MPSAGTAYLDIEGRLAKGFRANLERQVLPGIQGLAKKASDSLGKIGEGLQTAGRRITTGLTIPIAAIGGVALKTAVDFDSAFAGVRKTVDASEAQFAQLRQGIRDMAKEIPASASSIAGVAEAAGQLGIGRESILSFTRVMIDLGETTNLTAEEAATSLARLANITQLPHDQFDRLGATIVDLGNKLASTEREIVEMGLRIAGAGHTIGLTEAEILGFAGALSSVGIEAEAGGSAISRVFIKIAEAAANGGEELDSFARVAGVSASEFRRAFETDAAGAIVSFIEGLGQMQSEGVNTFGVLDDLGLSEIRVRDAMLRAAGAGDLFRQSIEIGSQAWEDNLALTDEADKRYKTTAAKFQTFKNKIMDVAITLGDSLIPAMEDAVEAAQPLIDFATKAAEKFRELSPTMQKFVVIAAALTAGLGPVVFIGGAIVSTFSGLAAAFAAVLSPVGLVVLAIAAVGVAIVLAYKRFEGFRNVVDAVGRFLRDKVGPAIADFARKVRENFQKAVDFVKEIWPQVSEAVRHGLNAIKAYLTPFIAVVKALWQALGDDLLNAAKTVWNFIQETINNALQVVSGIIRAVLAIINGDWGQAWDAIKSVISAVWDQVKNTVSTGINLVKSVIGGALSVIGAVWKAGWETVKDVLLGAVRGIVDTWLGAVEWIIRGAASAFGWVPGVGGKLKAAAREFEQFRDDVNAALGGIKDKTVNLTIAENVVRAGASPGKGSYKAQGSQGSRQHGGPVWPGTWMVGEWNHGAELLHLNPGSSGFVTNAVDTKRLFSQVGGREERIMQLPPIHVHVMLDGNEVARTIVDPMADELRVRDMALG
jgi:TP901 family phage tail tape measure protein